MKCIYRKRICANSGWNRPGEQERKNRERKEEEAAATKAGRQTTLFEVDGEAELSSRRELYRNDL